MSRTTTKSASWARVPVARFAVACLLLLLTSCSSTGFVYNRLDFLLPWYVGRYVDLNREQSKQFEDRLAPLLAWHRYDELPRYAAFLEQVEAALDAPLEDEQLQMFAREAEETWWRLRDRGLNELLALGEELDDEQIGEFLGELDKRQKKYERKYLSRTEAEYREDAFDELSDDFKDFMGRLQSEQRERLQLAVDQLQRSDQHWLSERAVWVAQLAVELERKPGWQQRVRQMVLDWENDEESAAALTYEHNNQVVRHAIVDVVNTRSPRQDKHLRNEIRSLREDLEELARRDEP